MNDKDITFNYISPNEGLTSITKLCCFGDSWTDDYWILSGIGMLLEYNKRPSPFIHWSHVIEREMRIPVRNHGYAGKLVKNLATGINQDGTSYPYLQLLLNDKPSHVTLMAGGNDIYNNYTVDQIMGWINDIYNVLIANNIKVILMWYPISAIDGIQAITKDEQWKRITEMRIRTKNFAIAHSLIHVDFFETKLYNGYNGVDNQYYLPDGVHVNSKGMPLIVNYLLPFINKGGV